MIYNNPIFINESLKINKKNIPYNVIYENGEFIKNCDMFITNELLENYQYNRDMVTRAALLEGAKLDLFLKNFIKNFMREGKDYKGLKQLINDVADECNKSGDTIYAEGKSGARKFLHICKRILQVLLDVGTLCALGFSGMTLASGIIGVFTAGPGALLTAILTIIHIVIGIIVSRAERYAVDFVEYRNAVGDAKSVVKELEALKTTKTDPKAIERIDKCIDKINKKIEGYEDRIELA